jgi:hypothetical protein
MDLEDLISNSTNSVSSKEISHVLLTIEVIFGQYYIGARGCVH